MESYFLAILAYKIPNIPLAHFLTFLAKIVEKESSQKAKTILQDSVPPAHNQNNILRQNTMEFALRFGIGLKNFCKKRYSLASLLIFKRTKIGFLFLS